MACFLHRNKTKSTETIEVQIIEAPVKHRPKPKLKPGASPSRIGSDEFKAEPHSIGVHATADNYYARLKERIDPNWLRLLNTAFRRKEARFIECITVLNIDGNAQGNILEVVILHTTCNKQLDNIAKEAIYYSGLLPPPKNLLVDGKIYLQWTFALRRE